MKPEQHDTWLAQLYMPLPGQEDKVSAEVVEDEMAAFRSLTALGG